MTDYYVGWLNMWDDGLLIRRSLVRAQVEEPKPEGLAVVVATNQPPHGANLVPDFGAKFPHYQNCSASIHAGSHVGAMVPSGAKCGAKFLHFIAFSKHPTSGTNPQSGGEPP